MYHAGGGSSVHTANPLQRCFHDVHVVTQHQRVNANVFPVAGRLYAGLGAAPFGFCRSVEGHPDVAARLAPLRSLPSARRRPTRYPALRFS